MAKVVAWEGDSGTRIVVGSFAARRNDLFRDWDTG